MNKKNIFMFCFPVMNGKVQRVCDLLAQPFLQDE